MRESGILLHITSLPSPYGIGTMGSSAFEFVDFLAASGQRIWQILPATPVSSEEYYSPYKSYSAFAGNPLWIDLDDLVALGLLDRVPDFLWCQDRRYVDFEKISFSRDSIFKTAFQRRSLLDSAEQETFQREHSYWLPNYVQFMALKEKNQGRPHQAWTTFSLDASDEEAIEYQTFLQFLFFKQWKILKSYANKRGVQIFGDLPIYVSDDSADFYFKKELFLTGEDGAPSLVAGVPPDGFSSKGQLWGNPLYDWTAMKQEDYRWWKERIFHQKRLYDLVRIDHFRGFESFYGIDASCSNGEEGLWMPGPGMELFHSLEESLRDFPIVAEDLGVITKEVRQLLKDSGFPGMSVLLFAFNGLADSTHLPHNHNQNMVVYTGTHDNQTVAQWLSEEYPPHVEQAVKYLRLNTYEKYTEGFLRAALGSVANRCIIPIQDYLDYGSWARMNTPSTVGDNWRFRLLPQELTSNLALHILELTRLYGR